MAKSVKSCRTARQFTKAVSKQGGSISQGSRHTLAHSPTGKGRVPIPRHTGQLPIGTRSSIIKMLISLGFVIFPLMCVLGTSLIIMGAIK